jgi:hypothetical protein
MLKMLKTIGSFCAALALFSLGAAGCGTDPEEACETVCSKNAECQPDSSKEACLSVCKQQVKDEPYADAIVEQADCYEDASCSDVTNGTCLPTDI